MRKALCVLLLFLSTGIAGWSNEGTVVAIHGFMLSSRSMVRLRNVLRCAKFDVCLWEYASRAKTIECHGDCLVTTLNQIACAKPGEPIHFVTHSIGSWVLRSALSHPLCPEEAKIGRTVLLAPPNQGSCLARHFQNFPPIKFMVGDRSGWELTHYEAEDVHRLGSFPDSMQVLVLAGYQGVHLWFSSANDQFLAVEETCLETPHTSYVLPLRHGQLLTNGRSLKYTRDFLLCGRVSQYQGKW